MREYQAYLEDFREHTHEGSDTPLTEEEFIELLQEEREMK